MHLGDLLDIKGAAKLTEKSNKTDVWHFRFHPTLQAAILKAVGTDGKDKTEVVSRKLCEALGIEYVALPMGRPWAKKAVRKGVKE